jgi:hypothetical protein
LVRNRGPDRMQFYPWAFKLKQSYMRSINVLGTKVVGALVGSWYSLKLGPSVPRFLSRVPPAHTGSDSYVRRGSCAVQCCPNLVPLVSVWKGPKECSRLRTFKVLKRFRQSIPSKSAQKPLTFFFSPNTDIGISSLPACDFNYL